jgi:hypothetical protein
MTHFNGYRNSDLLMIYIKFVVFLLCKGSHKLEHFLLFISLKKFKENPFEVNNDASESSFTAKAKEVT